MRVQDDIHSIFLLSFFNIGGCLAHGKFQEAFQYW